MGLPRSDNSVGGFPPGPSLAPAWPRYQTSLHCLSAFQPAQEPGPMQCQRAQQASGLFSCLEHGCLQPISPSGWSKKKKKKAGKVFYQCHSIKSRIPGPEEPREHLCPQCSFISNQTDPNKDAAKTSLRHWLSKGSQQRGGRGYWKWPHGVLVFPCCEV